MAVVDVIDLTISSPSVIDVDDYVKRSTAEASNGERRAKSKGKRKSRGKDYEGKQERKHSRERHRDRNRDEPLRHEKSPEKTSPKDDLWRHDKYDDSGQERGHKRKLGDDEGGSRRNSRRERSPIPVDLFSIDTIPSEIPGRSIPVPVLPVADIIEADLVDKTDLISNPTPDLLLPLHVTVAGPEESFIEPAKDVPLSPTSEASGIDFLDDDRAVGAPRYFQEATATSKTARSRACKKCGECNHDFKDCPNMICLTCGARNEHGTRSCPILRFCWHCKGKGHIARDCPRVGDMDQRRLDREDCERCGSWKHHGTNCPTLWRIYTYLTDAERKTVLAEREQKRRLGFGGGGEGYIARDHWCYNCGGDGHLGDDCDLATPNHDRPNEYSAFGSFNEQTGPFADPLSVIPVVERTSREWEGGDRFDDGYGFSAENNVGKKSREKAKNKAREAQRMLENDDGEPDWFDMNRTTSKDQDKTKSLKSKFGLASKPQPPKIHIEFNSSTSKPPTNARLPRQPTLLDRIDLGDNMRSSDRYRRDHERNNQDRRRRGGNRDRYSSRDRPLPDGGSRWRGGYDR